MFAIFSCVALGKLCAFFVPFLPGSLYGLIIFTLTLHLRVFNAEFGITIVMITFVTTFLLMTIVGLHYQRHATDDE